MELDKLSLVYKHEAEAIYSQQLQAKELVNEGTSLLQNPIENYMVIDIGNKAVDIHVTVKADLSDVFVTSIAIGCNEVNERFSKLLEKIVKDPCFSSFLSSGDQIKHTAVLNKLLYREFEQQCYTYSDGKIYEEMGIVLPNDIVKFYGPGKIADGAECIDGVDFDIEDEIAYFEGKVIEESVFGPPIQEIVNCIFTVLDDLACKIDTIYVLGKFGAFKYFIETFSRIIQTTKFRCCIIVPPSPTLAIASGAVMWRQNLNLMKPRRLDATYGIAVITPFDEDKHDSYYRFYDDEQQCFKCWNIFEVFLRKGQKVTANEVFTATIIPSHHSKTTMQLDVYSTPNLGVQYITDEDGIMNVTRIGKLVLDIPNPDNLPREKRIVDVTMRLIGTEIQTKAMYRVNGQEVKSVMDILSAHT